MEREADRIDADNQIKIQQEMRDHTFVRAMVTILEHTPLQHHYNTLQHKHTG